jgi:hypothetical protein
MIDAPTVIGTMTKSIVSKEVCVERRAKPTGVRTLRVLTYIDA